KNSGQRTMRTAGLTRQPTLPLRGVWKMEQIPGCSSVKGRKTVQQFIAAFRYGSLQTLHCRQDVAGEEMRKRNAFFHECPVVLEFGGRFCRAQPKEMCAGHAAKHVEIGRGARKRARRIIALENVLQPHRRLAQRLRGGCERSADCTQSPGFCGKSFR